MFKLNTLFAETEIIFVLLIFVLLRLEMYEPLLNYNTSGHVQMFYSYFYICQSTNVWNFPEIFQNSDPKFCKVFVYLPSTGFLTIAVWILWYSILFSRIFLKILSWLSRFTGEYLDIWPNFFQKKTCKFLSSIIGNNILYQYMIFYNRNDYYMNDSATPSFS